MEAYEFLHPKDGRRRNPRKRLRRQKAKNKKNVDATITLSHKRVGEEILDMINC